MSNWIEEQVPEKQRGIIKKKYCGEQQNKGSCGRPLSVMSFQDMTEKELQHIESFHNKNLLMKNNK